MKNIRKAIALVLAVAALFCLPIQASADEASATIDYTRTGSLSIYKYDLTRAESDGAWDTNAYVSTGIYDQSVVDRMADYTVPGVEFMYLRVADIAMYTEQTENENKVITVYGFVDGENTSSLLAAIGLSASGAYCTENNVAYFTSDSINSALAAALASNSTSVKTVLESYIKNVGGTAMSVTDEYGHSSADGLELGLYLVVETRVPENVTSTCNPFLISLPMTTLDGSAWNYDVTVYPKNKTGYYVRAKLIDGVYYVTEHVAEAAQATEFIPTAEGHIIIKGLEDDSYLATELATDTGYNLLKDDIKIVISVGNGAECANCHKPLLTATAKVNNKNVSMRADGDSENAIVPLTVVNTKGFTLPKTGSYGTWMFTIGGILAMGAALIIIFSANKKKRT